jgi:hypothetical protein
LRKPIRVDGVGEHQAEVVDDGCRLGGGEGCRELVDLGIVRGGLGVRRLALLLVLSLCGAQPLLAFVFCGCVLSLSECELRAGSGELLVVLLLPAEDLAHSGQRRWFESSPVRRRNRRSQGARVERRVLDGLPQPREVDVVVDREGRGQQPFQLLDLRVEIGVVGRDLGCAGFQIQPLAFTLIGNGSSLGDPGSLLRRTAHRLLLPVVRRLSLLIRPDLTRVRPLDLGEDSPTPSHLVPPKPAV